LGTFTVPQQYEAVKWFLLEARLVPNRLQLMALSFTLEFDYRREFCASI
jgi:hypothetical protein